MAHKQLVEVCNFPETTYIDCQGIQQKINAIPVIVENQKDIRREYYCDVIDDTQLFAQIAVNNPVLSLYDPKTGLVTKPAVTTSNLAYGTNSGFAYKGNGVQLVAYESGGALRYITEHDLNSGVVTTINPTAFNTTYTFAGVSHTIRGAAFAYNKATGKYMFVTRNNDGPATGEWGCVEYDPTTNAFSLVFRDLRSLGGFAANTSWNDAVWEGGKLYMAVNDGVGLPYGVYYINWTTGLYAGGAPVIIPSTSGIHYNGISYTTIPGVFIANSVNQTRYDKIDTNTDTVTVLFDWVSGTYPSAESTLPQTKTVKFYKEFCNGVQKGTFALDGTPYIPVGIPEECRSGCCDETTTSTAKVVAITNCDGTTTNKTVDNIAGAYLLNQKNLHTEIVYDVLTAVFGGTIAYTYNAPLEVILSYSGVTIANDTVSFYWTDFGDGYNDVGGNPSHAYNADGSYEIKSYAITASGNKILLIAKEVNIFGGVISYAPAALPQPVSATYKVFVGAAFQDYCGSLLVGSPYNADGTPYTLIGDFEAEKPIIIDLLEDNGDYQASVAAPVTTLVQRIHENFVQTGTTPLVIPAGAIAISVTKTNNTGVVNISGDNATDFPLTFNRENFADSVNEGYSTLSAYTITGTAAGTTFKVHIIR